MNKNIKNAKGFTIIEVVLVLAIAALIFLMVFVALPALRASQRDTARKNDASIVSAAITAYTTAYRHPIRDDSSSETLQNYVTDLDQHNKGDIKIMGAGANDAVPAQDTIEVRYAAKCDGPNAVSGTSRQATVRIRLEGNTAYCVDAS